MQRPFRLFAHLVFGACIIGIVTGSSAEIPANGIAIAVVFDAAGSMQDPMKSADKRLMKQKYLIAQRSFSSVIEPETVPPSFQAAALKQESPVFGHLNALDLEPSVLAALEKQGATRIGAANAMQLDTQFDFILEAKNLIEANR